MRLPTHQYMFALGTLQNELRQKKVKKTTYQSSGYKVKLITHTIVQTELLMPTERAINQFSLDLTFNSF